MTEGSATRNRLSVVVEIAIKDKLKNGTLETRPRPTIAELEDILNSENPPSLNILPDGSITVKSPVFASDLADAILGAIYADGWKIIPQENEPSTPSA